MIFFQILIFIVSIVLISISISGFGKLLSSNSNRYFFLNIFLGYLIISSIITFIHFFFKINLLLSFIIFALGLLIFFYNNKIKLFSFLKVKNIHYVVIILLLIPIYLSQKYHEDFGYYHLPYAIGLIEEKIIFGFANIDKPYVYNSIWLNLYSIFFLSDKNFNFLTLPTFLLFLNFITFSISQVLSKNEAENSDYFLIITLFYLILKFTRISEFGFDLPAIIFSILSIYYFIKFSETNFFEEKKKYFFLITAFAIFSILIKLSTLPIILLPTYLFFKNFKKLNPYVFNLKFCFIYILGIIFLIQQFIYTGCLFFPTNFTCLNVSWFNEENLKLSNELQLVNKSYFHAAKEIYSPDEYLKNFNWLIFWLKRNFIEITEHLLTIIFPIILFFIFLKKKKKSSFLLKEKFILYFFLVIGFLFWLNFSPVYRFATHLFVTLVFVVLIRHLMNKEFSKKIFLFFIMSFIFFNFSKNILRLVETNDIFIGIKKIENKYVLNEKNQNQIIKIYRPDVKKNSINSWQGRLCWNTPFICSYYKLEVKKKNSYLIIRKLKE